MPRVSAGWVPCAAVQGAKYGAEFVYHGRRPGNGAGAGGTGGYIAPHLYRIAFASGCTARIIIADGDIVEEKNLIRQNFAACDIGKNKAQVMAERYAGTFGIETEYIPDFIEDKKTLERLVDINCYY